jgi:hypothetical protein
MQTLFEYEKKTAKAAASLDKKTNPENIAGFENPSYRTWQENKVHTKQINRQPKDTIQSEEESVSATIDNFGLVVPEANLRSTPDTLSQPIKLLKMNTRVTIIKEMSTGWYYVCTETGETGYVASHLIKRGLPEPDCKLHKVESGETALRIAEKYYKSAVTDSMHDMRYFVSVLVFVNQGGGNPAKGIYTINAGDEWNDAQVKEGYYIWIPSLFYAKSLTNVFKNILDKINASVPLVGDVADFAGFLYDPVQGIFYSKMDQLQRSAGYFKIYDDTAPLMGMLIHSEPIKFRYDNRDWNIELWKGQYGIATGAEIGIYTGEFQLNTGIKEIDNFNNSIDFGTNTACASNSDLLQMSFTLKKKGKELFHREGKHWWLTGFKPGEISQAADLTMDIQITLQSEKMRKAFVEGLRKTGYSSSEISWNGNTVSFVFSKPKTEQPIINRILKM